jgi:hypothetical protein
LDRAGYEARHIMTVSYWSKTPKVRNYSRKH